jgi:hypothetical protein
MPRIDTWTATGMAWPASDEREPDAYDAKGASSESRSWFVSLNA